MYKLSRTRIFLILAICVIGIFFAIPNMMKDPSSLPKWWQPVNLGLDLQGGSNLLLEVKLDDVLKDRMSTVEDSARQLLRENKIRYQNLSAGSESVKVKIENLNSRNQARGLFKKIDNGILVEENEDGTLVIKYSEAALNELRLKVVDQSIEIVRRRIDELGTKEPVIQRQGYRIDRKVQPFRYFLHGNPLLHTAFHLSDFIRPSSRPVIGKPRNLLCISYRPRRRNRETHSLHPPDSHR